MTSTLCTTASFHPAFQLAFFVGELSPPFLEPKKRRQRGFRVGGGGDVLERRGREGHLGPRGLGAHYLLLHLGAALRLDAFLSPLLVSRRPILPKECHNNF